MPRRLRSEYAGAFWVEDTIVGCGYEVHTTTDGATKKGIRITRLSDGTSWKLWTVSGAYWWIKSALVITCQEAFLVASAGKSPSLENQLLRIRLDSLGPGEPHD
jgi:hypothetical protein